MQTWKKNTLLLGILLIIASCKKDHQGIPPDPVKEESSLEWSDIDDAEFSYGFTNIIIDQNLRQINTNTSSFLNINQAKYINSVGMQLMSGMPVTMKYPSTLDRSQLIFDVKMKPFITYIDSETGKTLSFDEVKNGKKPFKTSVKESAVYIGKSLFGIAGTVFGFRIKENFVYIELYRLTSGTKSTMIDDTAEKSLVKFPLNEFFKLEDRNTLSTSFNLRFVLTKDVNLNLLEVENLNTGIKVRGYGQSRKQSNGCQWGYGFIQSEQNDLVRLQHVTYRSLEGLSPTVLFIGHSFIEGNSLGDAEGGFDARYVALIKNKLKGKTVISGKGGATSQDVIDRLKMDLEPFFPKYVVIDCIANEGSHLTWKNNILKIIKVVQDKGAIPVLVTGAPRIGYTSVIKGANDLIRNELGHRYLDLNDVVAVGQSVSEWKPQYALSDAVHPSTLGHQKIADRFFKDFFDLFHD